MSHLSHYVIAKSWRNRYVIDIVTHIVWNIYYESWNREKKFFSIFFRIFEQGFAVVIGGIDPWYGYHSKALDLI